MCDAGDVAPGEERKPAHQEAEQEDQESSSDDLSPDRRVVITARLPCGEREVRRDSDDEQEERKDQVSRRPAVPGGVLERRVDRAPRPWIVDEQHAGDREAAEHVERHEPLARRRGHRCADRNGRGLGPIPNFWCCSRGWQSRTHIDHPVRELAGGQDWSLCSGQTTSMVPPKYREGAKL